MPLFVNPGAPSSKRKGGSSQLRAMLPTPKVGTADRRFPKTTTVSDGGTAQPLAAPIAGTPQSPPANAIDAGAIKTGVFGNAGLKSSLYNLRPGRFVRGAKDKSMPRLI